MTSAVEFLENRTLLSSVTGFANFTTNAGGGNPTDPNTGLPTVPVITGGTDLEITSNNGNEASSAWYNTPVAYNNFTASFTYTATPQAGQATADGIAFVLQNDTRGTAALGGGGGAIGYSGITPSFATSFNIYNGSKTGDNFNGGGNSNVSTTGTINLTSGDPIAMQLAYNSNASTLSESLKDMTTGATYTTTFTGVNLPTQLGAATATMGFTGGTGGAWAQQDITNFVYATNASPPPPAGQISGFTGFSINGSSPAVSNDANTLTLTTATNGQDSSAFFSTPATYRNFTANFTYQETGGTTPPADGFAFVLENDTRAAAALGSGGTSLGYGGTNAITPSVAAEFNINGSGVGVGANGSISDTATTGSVNLASGDPIKITLAYNSASVTETLTDTVTNATYTTSYNNVNIPAALGIDTAYVGFTGSTDAANNAKQTISGFTFTPNTSTQPPAVTGPVNGFGNWSLNAANGKGVDGGNPGDNNNGTSPTLSTDTNTLTITTANNNQASSAFFNSPVGYQNFNANFTYTMTKNADGVTAPADGFTFTIQDDSRGPLALAGGGGQLAYGTDAGHPASPITPSFSAQFNVYQVSSIGEGTNGGVAIPYAVSNTGSVNLGSGDPIAIHLAYNSAQYSLTETLTDTVSNATYTTLFTGISLPGLLGSNSGYIGITGATGGANAMQAISNFSYSTSATAPALPTLPAAVNSVTGFNNFNLDASSAGPPAGVPSVTPDGTVLTITTANNNEATAAWYNTPVNYGNFNASFTYAESAGSSATPADGISFVLERTPSLNNGSTGGNLGYGPNVPNSFAVEFNVYQVTSTNIGAEGAVTVPYNAGGNTGNIILTNGDPINVTLAYSSANKTLTETLTDSPAGVTYSTTYKNIDLALLLGNSPSAYVGITGGTGGANAVQTITNFTYSATAAAASTAAGPQVNLTGDFTNYGIGADGNPTTVTGGGTNGFDGGGYTYSNTYFTNNTVTANGVTFNTGDPTVPNTITANGQTINLPQGKYGSISMLGAAVNGNQKNQVFNINYTDGTSTSDVQGLSDWFSGATFPGETVAVPMTYRLDPNGAQNAQGANISVYQYTLATDPSKTVASITLPLNGNVKILALDVNTAVALPAYLASNSQATYNAATNTVTVTGNATIIADPGTAEPNIVASGSAAKLAITPATSPTDVHIGGITLTNGASVTMTSVGSGRSHANHNVLVLGPAGATNDPTLSVDATSKLDLSDNDMIVHTGSSDANGAADYANVIALATKGRNPQSGASGTPDGQWNGNGLDSSAAAAADNSAGYEKIGLGIVVNSTLLTGQLASWQVGSASENLGANDVIVKYTYLSDYALEGQVYQDDAGILQLEYDGGTASNHTWATGSSLFDGKADNNEAGLMQLQYGLGTGGVNGPQL